MDRRRKLHDGFNYQRHHVKFLPRIGISTRANDHDSRGQTHETSTIKNVKGTVLYRGTAAYNGADVGTWENVKFHNTYWANAGAAYNAPSVTTLNSWTRSNGIGFVLGIRVGTILQN